MVTRKTGITRFGLRNFKAFRYLEDIELRPLTLLVGANSAGKSSIFQSLLLLKQSLISGVGNAPLKFDGELVRLGGFSTIVSDFDISRDLEYRFSLATHIPQLILENQRIDIPPVVSHVGITFSLRSTGVSAAVKDFWIQLDKDEQTDAPGAHYQTGKFQMDGVSYEIDQEGRALFLEGFIPRLDLFEYRVVEGAGIRLPKNLGRLTFSLMRLRKDLTGGLDYLGPVRADPRPFYPVSEDPEIGPRGEGAIPYLLQNKSATIQYCQAPGGDPVSGTLFEALNHWLRRMNVTPGISIDPVESIAYTAAVRTPLIKSRPVNLAQVGFGVSQLLPVLLQGLRNPTDGLTLFEQPEIHLHPRLQGELGDFFLSCAGAGKTLMIETHSDHLVHRIRRRVAEDTTGKLADLVQILFVHPGNEENPGSYVEPLRIGPDGAIENWPDDFLQDAADEAWAILRARRARAQQGSP